MPHVHQKMGDSMSTINVLPLGQGGAPLGQQNWGTQCSQQNYCHWVMEDAAFTPKKNGGLNVHNESIAARAKGDTAWATKLGDSKSTMKSSLPGNGFAKNGGLNIHNESIIARARGMPLGQQNWGTQRPQQNYFCRAMRNAAFAPKNGGPNVHTKSITARAKGGHRSGNKKGGTHILQQTNILTNGPWHHLAENTRMRCLVRQRSLGSSNLARAMFSGHGQSV
jgi:hypothetical protein